MDHPANARHGDNYWLEELALGSPSMVDSSSLQSAAAAIGNGTAVSVQGYSTAIIAISGTFVGTIVFEGQGPDDVWYTLNAKPVGGYSLVSSVSTAGAWLLDVAALTSVRARISAYTSGSITASASLIVEQGHTGIQNANQATKFAGEDLTNDVMKVEQRFSYFAPVVADVQLKATAGFLHTITLACNDAAPTAGTLIIYDSATETGTQIFNCTFTTTPFNPLTLTLDVNFNTACYIGFTTTGDVNVSASYR